MHACLLIFKLVVYFNLKSCVNVVFISMKLKFVICYYGMNKRYQTFITQLSAGNCCEQNSIKVISSFLHFFAFETMGNVYKQKLWRQSMRARKRCPPTA